MTLKKGKRYDVSSLVEAQFEPGSRGRVLKNLLSIKDEGGGRIFNLDKWANEVSETRNSKEYEGVANNSRESGKWGRVFNSELLDKGVEGFRSQWFELTWFLDLWLITIPAGSISHDHYN